LGDAIKTVCFAFDHFDEPRFVNKPGIAFGVTGCTVFEVFARMAQDASDLSTRSSLILTKQRVAQCQQSEASCTREAERAPAVQLPLQGWSVGKPTDCQLKKASKRGEEAAA
jgi:hypothetical protein